MGGKDRHQLKLRQSGQHCIGADPGSAQPQKRAAHATRFGRHRTESAGAQAAFTFVAFGKIGQFEEVGKGLDNVVGFFQGEIADRGASALL